MSLIRRVNVPQGQTVQVIPPDGGDHAGQWKWRVLNPTGSAGPVELVDDIGKTIGAGRPLAAGAEWDTVAREDTVFAAGTAAAGAVVLQVTGTRFGD